MMVSFIDAILMRYSDANYFEQSSNCNIFIIGSLSPGKSGNHLILPPALCLNGCSINCAGSERKIKESCRNVEELDLGSNELTSLDEVLTIVKCLPNLRFLNLSENDLSNTTLPSSSHVTVNDNDQTSCNSFPELRSLVLNNTRIHWSAIVYLLQLMPKLTELHLSLNNYESVDIDRSIVKQFHHTRRLYISGNPNLSDWNEISRLVSVFPGLEVLTMADCNVQVIPRDLDNVLPWHCVTEHLQLANQGLGAH
ncbi:Tubulin-specific chaperone cofactor E-like protein [Halotydeus destructor]|nr:Tubulin-specific chaperone cofactor E-like protein [Halotydeus destructor]